MGVWTVLGGVGKAALGQIAAWGWVEWAELDPSTSGTDVLTAALQADRGIEAIGALTVPRQAANGELAYWAARKGGGWYIPADRFGRDIGKGDEDVELNEIDAATITTTATGGNGTNGTNGSMVPTGGAGDNTAGADHLFGFAFGRKKPRMITQRRCPRGMRLAKDGWCYPTKILPVSARANQPKKALISHSDGVALRRGRQVQKRLKTLFQDSEKENRKIFPRRRK